MKHHLSSCFRKEVLACRAGGGVSALTMAADTGKGESALLMGGTEWAYR